jgi:hypothetical protein
LAPGILRAALEAMPRGLAFSPADLRRLTAMAMGRYLEPLADAGEPGAQELLEQGFIASVAAVAEALGTLGFVALGGDGLVRATSAIDSALRPVASSGAAGAVIVEESHEIRIMPEADLPTRAFISAIARLERTGLVWSAILDKASAKAAYAYGFGSEEIAARLEAVSGMSLPQSVRFSLGAWEAEVRSARLRVGVVVALDGHLSGVLEHSPKAEGLVQERLAARDAAEAERMLKSAGIDVDMRPSPEDDGSSFQPLWDEAKSALVKPIGAPPLAFRPISDTIVSKEAPLVEKLLSTLEGLVVSLDERADLEARIRAKLVLDESELIRAEPTEQDIVAGAMDYPGKVRLLERAMKDGATVRIEYLDDDGTLVKIAGVPRDVRREASGTVVALSSGGAEQTVVAIGAIEIVRRRIVN